MNRIYSVIILLLLVLMSEILPQEKREVPSGTVFILSHQINFVDTVITGYRHGNTRIYPPTSYPVIKLLYRCSLTLKLNGERFSLADPICVKCVLPDGNVQINYLNKEHITLYSDKIYEYNFDFLTGNKLRGRASIELLKYKKSYETEDSGDLYDKVTLFIN